MRQLSESWRTRVLREESKFASRFFTAKLSGTDLRVEQLKNVLNALGIQVKKIERQRSCYLVQVVSEEDLRKLQEQSGLLLGGVALMVTRVRKRWSTSEIFNYVAKELKIEKESRIYLLQIQYLLSSERK